MLIAARDNNYSVKDQARIVLETVKQYRTTIGRFAEMDNLEVWYADLDVEKPDQGVRVAVQAQSLVKNTAKTAAKARTRDSMSAFSKLTHLVDGEVRIGPRRVTAHRADRSARRAGR